MCQEALHLVHSPSSAIHLLLIVAEPLPTHRADVMALFGKYLPRLGITSDIVATTAPGAKGAASDWPVGRSFLTSPGATRPGRVLGSLWHALLQVSARSKPGRYQVIQARDTLLSAAFALGVARARGTLFSYWMSYPMADDALQRARTIGRELGIVRLGFVWLKGQVGRALLYRLVLPRADQVFVQSQIMLESLANAGIPRTKLFPVPMGIDTELLEKHPVTPSSDPRLAGRRVLIYLGILDRARKPEFLLSVTARVRQAFPDVLLLLVGDATDPVDRDRLDRRIRELGLRDHVLKTGWLPVHEGWSYVRCAEVALSPLPRDPLLDSTSPTKVVEYLALGVPVLVNGPNEQADLVRASGGGRTVEYDVNAFANAVCNLFSDPPRSRRLGDSGRKYVTRERSYHLIAEAVAERYQAMLDSVRATR